MDEDDRAQEVYEGWCVGLCPTYRCVSFARSPCHVNVASSMRLQWVANEVRLRLMQCGCEIAVLFLCVGLYRLGGSYVGSGSS